MKKKKSILIILFVIICLVVTGYVFLFSPKHTEGDDALFKWISSEKNLVFYKNNPEIIATSEETERAHDNYMRIKLNKIAASVLDSAGRLPKGAAFPDSSVIIKEIYSEKTGSVDLLAVMVKLKGAANSGRDWLWAEYLTTGETVYSVEKKGKVCVSCHKPGNDYVRAFDILK